MQQRKALVFCLLWVLVLSIAKADVTINTDFHREGISENYEKTTNVDGRVIDEKGVGLAYPTVRIKNKCIGAIGDSLGVFHMKSKGIMLEDTLTFSYVGYATREIALADWNQEESVELEPRTSQLRELAVYSNEKRKRVKQGKKHSWAMMTGCYDDDIAGQSIGFEFHAKKGKRLVLDRIGFYYCEGESQMSKMKFRINVYDMSNVKENPTKNFVNVLDEPIFFDYILSDDMPRSGKFEYILPNVILLPEDAMVEIEFLENLSGERFYFKCNLLGKKIWGKDVNDITWSKDPFATPFYVECLQIKE